MHYVKPNREPLRWLHSIARSIGDVIWGVFLPIAHELRTFPHDLRL